MTTGRINQVTDRRSLCHGRIMTGQELSIVPTGADCGAADDRRDLPVKVIARPVSKRQFPTDDRTPPTTSPSNATHRRGTHAGSPAANAFHFPRALLAFQRPKLSSPPSHRQPTRSYDRSLPSDGDTGIRAVGPKESIRTGALPQPWIREDLRRAHRESRDDQCSFPHDLPGITTKLLSLTLWRIFPRKTSLERTLPRNFYETSAARTILRLRTFSGQMPLIRYCMAQKGDNPRPHRTVGTTLPPNCWKHSHR